MSAAGIAQLARQLPVPSRWDNLWRRTVARWIDSFVMNILTFMVFLLLLVPGSRIGIGGDGEHAFLVLFAIAWLGASLLVTAGWIYFECRLIARGEQVRSKRFLSLGVVTATGTTPSGRRVFVRLAVMGVGLAVTSVLLDMGGLWTVTGLSYPAAELGVFLFGPPGSSLHDLIAGTRVAKVEEWPSAPPTR